MPLMAFGRGTSRATGPTVGNGCWGGRASGEVDRAWDLGLDFELSPDEDEEDVVVVVLVLREALEPCDDNCQPEVRGHGVGGEGARCGCDTDSEGCAA